MQVLVLAGSRGGEDPVALHAGVDQKCLAPVAGRTMIEHVAGALLAVGDVERIHIAANDPGALATLPVLADPRIATGGCEPTPSLTVAACLKRTGTPLLVTTADHPLLTPAILERFLMDARGLDADLAVGLVRSETVLAASPHTRRTWLTFRGGRYSGANLFWLARPQAASAVAFWRRVEQERKKPWRIARAMGPGLLLSYLLHRLTLDQALERASVKIGARARAVLLPFAEAAIDVDKPDDLEYARAILQARKTG
ncbi:MAG: nucleotidyltransferase family protein [Geminicoccaceae bacterium]|nr:nucleotidyltransferase family protein [Geminicoccaceae bacterium]